MTKSSRPSKAPKGAKAPTGAKPGGKANVNEVAVNEGRWEEDEHERFLEAMAAYKALGDKEGMKKWPCIAEVRRPRRERRSSGAFYVFRGECSRPRTRETCRPPSPAGGRDADDPPVPEPRPEALYQGAEAARARRPIDLFPTVLFPGNVPAELLEAPPARRPEIVRPVVG